MNGSTGTVGFDGFYLNFKTTGMGQYATELWQAYQASGDLEPGVRLLRPDLNHPDHQNSVNTVSISAPAGVRDGKPAKIWWEQRGVIRAARRAGVSVIHIPYFSAPIRSPFRTIITIHDVIPFVFPEYRNSMSMRAYLRLMTRSAHDAAAIITDSEYSRIDIERYIGIDRKRITVVPLAAHPRFRPMRDRHAEAEIRSRMQLPGPVIFNVGGLDVRKNVPALIRAFAHALPDLDPATRLVIAGHAHSGNRRLYPPVQSLVRQLGLVGKVILPGRISEADKLLLYNIADLYVFTSLYEGFGLSPLEAMACGTPVICSNRSSLPEVVGDGGLLIDPLDDEITGAITALMNDEEKRRRLGEQGREQAARFSWQRSAELTRDVYRRVLAGE